MEDETFRTERGALEAITSALECAVKAATEPKTEQSIPYCGSFSGSSENISFVLEATWWAMALRKTLNDTRLSERDDCSDYIEGIPSGDCASDGHYLCKTCSRKESAIIFYGSTS
jgi:hypothetical protein